MSEGGLGGFAASRAMQGRSRARSQMPASGDAGNAGVPRAEPSLGAANALA